MDFPTHTIDTAPVQSAPTLRRLHAKFGVVPTAAARLATSPLLLNTFLQDSAAFEASSLGPAEREVVVLTVALRNDCKVCVAMHAPLLAKAAGPDVVTRMRTGQALGEPRLDAVRLFTQRVLDHAGGVEQAQLREFLDAGFTGEQALEVVMGVGVYTMSTLANRLVRA